jgi:hypothetical protein
MSLIFTLFTFFASSLPHFSGLQILLQNRPFHDISCRPNQARTLVIVRVSPYRTGVLTSTMSTSKLLLWPSVCVLISLPLYRINNIIWDRLGWPSHSRSILHSTTYTYMITKKSPSFSSPPPSEIFFAIPLRHSPSPPNHHPTHVKSTYRRHTDYSTKYSLLYNPCDNIPSHLTNPWNSKTR